MTEEPKTRKSPHQERAGRRVHKDTLDWQANSQLNRRATDWLRWRRGEIPMPDWYLNKLNP